MRNFSKQRERKKHVYDLLINQNARQNNFFIYTRTRKQQENVKVLSVETNGRGKCDYSSNGSNSNSLQSVSEVRRWIQ